MTTLHFDVPENTHFVTDLFPEFVSDEYNIYTFLDTFVTGTTDPFVVAGRYLSAQSQDLNFETQSTYNLSFTIDGDHIQQEITGEIAHLAFVEHFDVVITVIDGPDSLVGDNSDNVFTVNAGDDFLDGCGGNDILSSGIDNDTLLGGEGDDILRGGPGDDLLDGDGGAQNNFGEWNVGYDIADYSDATGGVTVDLGIFTAQNTGGAGADTLVSIEGLTGSAFDDTLTGNRFSNTLRGGPGNDHISGGALDDILDGGPGDDTLDGGTGTNTLDFSAAAGAIRVNLTLAGAQNTGEGLDTITGIQNITGSAFGDVLTGQAADNRFDGGDGDDELHGGSGSDTLNGDNGADLIIGDAGEDVINGGAGMDRLFGGSSDDTLNGGADADTLAGGPGVDRVDGGGGADRLYADGTADTFVFGSIADAGDRVFAFQSGVHELEATAAGFGGTAAAFDFVANATPNPTSGTQAFLFDTDNGKLFFDADGSGAGARVYVGQLFAPGGGVPALATGDILLV